MAKASDGLLDTQSPERVFRLTAADRGSDLWFRMHGWLEMRLDELRRRNDHKNLSAEDTAFLRGQIAEIKGLVALNERGDGNDG